MRFESVRAHPFGPFTDRMLEFAPGMTVIYGPNEAGKSTWHAALYAGLCGMRRGRGPGTKEERELAARHRPWDDPEGPWAVTAVVALADGRRVELLQDLANKANCSATDFDLASRDYASEIVHDGSPDGSRFLGLNRTTFLGAACVRQAGVLAVLDDPEAMQEDLQRAAATAGADATAARALELLEDCHREQVGSSRATTKPLAKAKERVASARVALDEAQRRHDGYVRGRARLEEIEEEARQAEQRVEVCRALDADIAATEAEERAERAAQLQARFPDGPPRATVEDDRLVSQTADALARWRARPTLRRPGGPAVEELEQERAVAQADRREVAATVAAPEPVRTSIPRLVLGGAGVVAGVALWLADLPVPGLVALAGGLGLLASLALSNRRQAPAASRPDAAAAAAVLEERLRRIASSIEQRRAADQRYTEASGQRKQAAAALRAAAAAVGVTAVDPEAQVTALNAWQRARRQRLEEQARHGAQWDELQQVRGGRTVDEMRAQATALRAEAEALAARVDATRLTSVRTESTAADALDRFEARAREARAACDTVRGELVQRAVSLPSVVGAEEESAAAERHLAHVEELGQTVEATIEFLQRAEERVHRDIAPVLKQTVLGWLPQVTGGRYDDCKVDPESLKVDVRGGTGPWRDAQELSRGTAEQVYLLLRVALARHLTGQDEACPMILDDVVAACDGERKKAVLRTLQALGGETQVILFTHEEDVLAWSRNYLSEPEDRLVLLPPPEGV